MKRKVLIIGSKGMLGQELTRVFGVDNNYNVTAWDKGEIDITQVSRTKDQILESKPDIIINTAAYNAVDKCEKDKKEYEIAKLLNGYAPGNLAEIAQEIGAIFVHYSTDYVFNGSPDKQEFIENDEPNPISNYGRSKLLGEQQVQAKGDKYYIIRLSKLFGKPALSKESKRSFFDIMLELGKKMAKENKELKVVNEEVSCFTYAPDLAQTTKEIIETNQPYGIYHITNSKACTWYEAAHELFALTKINVNLKAVTSDEFPRPAKRPKFSVLKNTKLSPLRNYKEALKEYLSE
ncbi:dTDP-4-dehydrorhamnose reductase [Patescibacteria group bacterium]|nr:dTDP-4-dehydrorhamnose reductase [Patescibacteria group bacterium]